LFVIPHRRDRQGEEHVELQSVFDGRQRTPNGDRDTQEGRVGVVFRRRVLVPFLHGPRLVGSSSGWCSILIHVACRQCCFFFLSIFFFLFLFSLGEIGTPPHSRDSQVLGVWETPATPQTRPIHHYVLEWGRKGSGTVDDSLGKMHRPPTCDSGVFFVVAVVVLRGAHDLRGAAGGALGGALAGESLHDIGGDGVACSERLHGWERSWSGTKKRCLVLCALFLLIEIILFLKPRYFDLQNKSLQGGKNRP
jgi:hypothetical protein